MGIRETQPMGLAPRAEAFLKEHGILKDYCEHCDRNNGYERRVYQRVGMFDDLALCEYTLKDGRTARQFVQREVWSSGPMIWTALEVEGEKFLWPEEEIEKILTEEQAG